jgi:nicotinamide riboside kinase
MKTNIKRIGICGSHSCGKTTLVHELSKHLPEYPTIEETAGLFPRSVRSYMETQCAIMRVQIEKEKRCRPRMLTDRTVMDNLAYMNLIYSECPQMVEDDELLHFAKSRYNKHMMTSPYDLIVFVNECLPIEDDGRRCPDPFYQFLIYRNLKEIVEGARKMFGGFDILYVKGSTDARIESIIRYIRES